MLSTALGTVGIKSIHNTGTGGSITNFKITELPDAASQGVLYINGTAQTSVTATEFPYNATLSFDPNENFSGTAVFKYQVENSEADNTYGNTAYYFVQVNKAPSVPTDANTAGNTVSENAANGTEVGITASATDPEGATITYSLSNNSGGRFAIDASTGVVTVANGSLLNYESAIAHSISVQASDGHFTSSQTFTIVVTDVNEAPSTSTDANATANAVPENSANGTLVNITASSADPEGAPISYTLTDNAGGRFAIHASTGVVTVANGALLDFETATSYSITVQASDGGLTSTQTFTIAVTNDNEGPSVPIDVNTAANTVAENSAGGTLVGITASSTDPDAGTTLTYSLSVNPENRFAINSSTGVVSVASGAVIDFETTPSLDITVQVSDGSLTSSQTFTIEVTNVNEAPVITSASAVFMPENTTYVITVTATDPENGTLEYFLDANSFSSPDYTKFNVKSNTGELSFVNYIPNYEAPGSAAGTNVYTVGVLVGDGNLFKSQTITVTITDVVDENPPSTPTDVNAETNTIPENAVTGTVVGVTAYATDAEARVSYSLSDDAGGRFAIDASTGVVTVANGALLNFEAATSHTIRVLASDGTHTTSQIFTIAVTNVNEAPVFTSASSVSVPENTTSVMTVAATDPENNTIVYSISTSPDQSSFRIDPATGALSFMKAPDYEAPGSAANSNVYTVAVIVSDGVLSKEQTITVTVTEVTEETPLPVALLNFKATRNKKNALLTWQTATEQENETFEVERSTNGRNFSKIGQVAGAGNSLNLLNYSFTDNNPLEGINYYRLRQVDFNGESETSAIVAVKYVTTITEVSMLSYPNPTSAAFTLEISMTNPENIIVEIRDIAGKLVRASSYAATAGLNKIKYDLNQEVDGMYIITVKGKDFQKANRIIKSGSAAAKNSGR
ncbi:hypothetical protein DC20_15040 [Rufibacter tibetensis]|uniref:Cadherin domain-containing protein n=1 Tax=Rufibacter tibetensis TaxID=512763 RepID=A0A0P0CRK2_9BACT|nr:hypothetical protein DC20_15040 [Rufibacter tibetensis]